MLRLIYLNQQKYFVDLYRQPIKLNSQKIPAHGYSKLYEKFFFDKKEKHGTISKIDHSGNRNGQVRKSS